MDRAVFAAQFVAACAAARGIAALYLVEPLPAAQRFRVRLNESYDGHPLVGDQIVYPEDSAFARALALHDVGLDEVVAELWRDGRVPEWIELSVSGASASTTRLDVRCCGRFSALLPRHDGRPAFHLRSPHLPHPHAPGARFSVHTRSECWSAAELAHAARHADRVWLLELVGPAFGDAELAALPPFPALANLVLRHTRVQGPGLAGLDRAPALRTLRVHLAPHARFDRASLPRLPRLRVDLLPDPKARPTPAPGLWRQLRRIFTRE